MAALGSKLRTLEGDQLAFWCLGCKISHAIHIGSGDGPRWGFNGNAEKPTFTPSVLVRSGHYARHHTTEDECWCTYNAAQVAAGKPPSGFECCVCHSFVTDGRIQFLGDSTHALAGQTVDLPGFPMGDA